LVAGAGIAGLTFAALMKQRGRDVELIDRAGDFQQAGFALGLYPLGGRILNGLGAMRRYRTLSYELDFYDVANGRGSLIKRFDFRPLTKVYGDFRMIERGTLLSLLHDLAGNPSVMTNTVVEDIVSDGEKMAVRLSNGSVGHYDLVVGADGIHSTVRTKVMPEHEVYDTGWACWSHWVPNWSLEPRSARDCWGAGKLLGLYPGIERGCVVSCGPAKALGNGAAEGRRARVQKLFRGVKGAAKEAVAAFPNDDAPMFFWKFEDRRAKQWVKGRVCLLGDAACAFLPTAGIGASMAIESAAVLAEELSRANTKTVPQALAFYEKRRRHRVEAAQNDSRRLARMMFFKNPLLAFARNQLTRFMTFDTMASDIRKMLDEPI
ncbi:MAG TPA: NAD(P)/FAD-dependent oxidoreductase, partial [Rhizomicrobium sp.]|nr:NAD(P)/FAD-dependent oxidoreductase [Rhizomicrobium sp.]